MSDDDREAPTGNPFAQLLGLVPGRLPHTKSAAVVVDGRRVDDVRQLRVDDEDELERLRREKLRAYYAARYQRDRQDPAKMAKRQAWLEANRDKVRAWKKAYDERTQERQREQKAAWQRHKTHASVEAREKAAAASRRYYREHREEILAKLAAERAAKKAAP